MAEKFPGFPGPGKQTIEQREAITAAVVGLHRAMSPLLDFLDSKCTLQMTFKVAGDKLTVRIVPGHD